MIININLTCTAIQLTFKDFFMGSIICDSFIAKCFVISNRKYFLYYHYYYKYGQ